jgi:hypothetical protein
VIVFDGFVGLAANAGASAQSFNQGGGFGSPYGHGGGFGASGSAANAHASSQSFNQVRRFPFIEFRFITFHELRAVASEEFSHTDSPTDMEDSTVKYRQLAASDKFYRENTVNPEPKLKILPIKNQKYFYFNPFRCLNLSGTNQLPSNVFARNSQLLAINHLIYGSNVDNL